MNNQKLYHLLIEILLKVSKLSNQELKYLTINELIEHLKLWSTDVYEAFDDFFLTLESMDYIVNDSLLRSNAHQFWLDQVEVFKKKIVPASNHLKMSLHENQLEMDSFIDEITSELVLIR